MKLLYLYSASHLLNLKIMFLKYFLIYFHITKNNCKNDTWVNKSIQTLDQNILSLKKKKKIIELSRDAGFNRFSKATEMFVNYFE